MIKLKGVQKCLNTESLNKFQKSNMLLIIRQYILLLFSVSSFFIISTSVIEAQPTRNSTGLSLQGTVVDNADKALRGASVAVVSQRDKNFKSGVVTDKDGKFKLDNLPAGEYSIEISFIGFRKHTQSFKLSPNNRNIGTVKLEEGDVNLGEITVEAQMLRQEQKEDTTIYNADAFKVNPDATTEDLLKKMP
ncbi:MAG: carboxypeptidase-like regulatory domain-containing protein, partial [Candidatus Kapaibacterium sp.]